MGFTCEIMFPDNPNGVFFSGQTLTGAFKLNLDKITKIKTIWLCVRGTAKCNWSPGSNNKNSRHFIDHENYFQLNTILLSSDESGEPASIPMGIQTYTFACELPQLLPSSFEGKYGHIRYNITVTVECPWKFDRKTMANFTVINQYDLNILVPTLRNPYESNNVRNFCCWPCQTGEVTIRVNLPRTAYIPGEKIPIEITIKNDSDVSIIKTNLCFIKLIIYRTFNGRKGKIKEDVQLCKESIDGTPSFTTKQFHKHLQIPPVIPSSFCSRKIIKIEYSIMVKVKTSFPYNNILLYIPIVIGIIAYSELTPHENTQPMVQSIPHSYPHHLEFITQQPAEAPVMPLINANTDQFAPPPSYDEIVYG